MTLPRNQPRGGEPLVMQAHSANQIMARHLSNDLILGWVQTIKKSCGF